MPSWRVTEIVRAVRVELTALSFLSELTVLAAPAIMAVVAVVTVLIVLRCRELAFHLRHPLLQLDMLERAQVSIEQLRHVVRLRRRQVAARNGRPDVGKPKALAGWAGAALGLGGGGGIRSERKSEGLLGVLKCRK
jgi:hypothetical protein